MANEAVVIELTNSTGFRRRYTCASGTSISEGSLLVLSDPRTVAAHTAAVGSRRGAFAGIAAMDKDGTDYSTSISAYTNGIFDLKASGAITVGSPVYLGAGAANVVEAAILANDASGAELVGIALETASDAEVINVRVNI